jgi:hypothetical protein
MTSLTYSWCGGKVWGLILTITGTHTNKHFGKEYSREEDYYTLQIHIWY